MKQIIRIKASFCVAVLALSGVAPAAWAKESPGPPPALDKLLGCRVMRDDAARLACYDGEAARLKGAVDSGDVIVTDRETMNRTRRSLFGLNLPALALFAHRNGKDDKEVNELEAVIASARQQPDRRWLIKLQDGATWLQIDDIELNQPPEPGMPIKIRIAAMGSYLANVNHQIAIRMRRIN